MFRVTLESRNDLHSWRKTVRPLLAAGITPDSIIWLQQGDQDALFGEPLILPHQRFDIRVSREFLDCAETALCHADPRRFDLLYRIAFRMQDERKLLEIATDPDVIMLTRFNKAVRRDSHKMKAFVRFRAVDETDMRFAAWFEPEHFTLERTAPFFAERFAGMEWAILTPYRSALWDKNDLAFGEGARKQDVPAEDAMEDAWRTYFASIFNPARLKVSAMTSEMPRKYWRNLPEAELIDGLIRTARTREAEMVEKPASEPSSRHMRQSARALAPAPEALEFETLDGAAKAIRNCTRCPLYEHATQSVFGEGPKESPVMFVGEQPGDTEDLAGRPFVGPAGQLLDEILHEVRIDRQKLYVTNAVKHFKFVPRGKRRLHQKPNGGEVSACRFWLSHEIALVKPKVIVALGATAAQSLLGSGATISKLRGVPIEGEEGTTLFVTVHPSYLLRLPDRGKAATERAAFARDLAMIRDFVQSEKGTSLAA